MSNSRRGFLKKAALMAGSASMWNVLPSSIEKAMAITPDPGTTFYDAEHVVMLMQENRSFDHCFGTLKGVRGFNDPRAISLPENFPVWLQPDKEGKHYAPFRLDIKNTKVSWMGDLPHSWENQVDARNQGKYDGWIEAKRSGKREFKDMPLTMGYYSREDIPFYYALADAFTVCDQHFCASLTGTTTNRNYFWTGKTHHRKGDKAKVRNGEMGYDDEVNWETFPERLEEHGISWKIYQNEISLPTNVEDSSLLASFTDNNLEWFSQYHVRFSPGHYAFLKKKKKELAAELTALEEKFQEENTDEVKDELTKTKAALEEIETALKKWSPENFEKLQQHYKNLHQKAFTTNLDDPDYHKVEEMTYTDNGESRTTQVPKGDILHQFRKDVNEGKLPTVSWVVAPQKFSDHPSAPWYGAWYVSEVLDILTQNPEVWKKTIFILNYDENDGYFDHVPPFVAPDPNDPDCGKMSEGLDVSGEFVTHEEELKAGFTDSEARTSPVGLGYRVPLVVASPWSRGGWVNSEVCDITSTIQFLEKFLSKKTGKKIEEPNISSWRRAVSGDLSSVFRTYQGEKINYPEWVNRDEHVQKIYSASFKKLPTNYKALTASEARVVASQGAKSSALPRQEPGTKPSNALKYELYTDGRLSDDGKHFIIRFKAAQNIFGKEALGAPFNVYAPNNYWNKDSKKYEPVKAWTFAVKSGDELAFQWPLEAFEGGKYHLRVYGPNGYFCEFAGDAQGPRIAVSFQPLMKRRKYTDQLEVLVKNLSNTKRAGLRLSETVYQQKQETFTLTPSADKSIIIDATQSQGWYDFVLHSEDNKNMEIRFAGRIENGKDRITDPLMA